MIKIKSSLVVLHKFYIIFKRSGLLRIYIILCSAELFYCNNAQAFYHFSTVLFVCFQTDEQEVINFLLTTEIIPLCLRIMESGSELSKTVSEHVHC